MNAERLLNITDYAFENPVLLGTPTTALVRTLSDAAYIVRLRLRERFTLAGLNTLLMLERATEEDEVEGARQAFCSWAQKERFSILN